MGHSRLLRRPTIFQHGLDQLDPTSRAVAFIAQENVCRAGRSAEATVHALANFSVARRGLAVGELVGCECRLHQAIRPRLRTPRGSKAAFTRAVSVARGPLRSSKPLPSPL